MTAMERGVKYSIGTKGRSCYLRRFVVDICGHRRCRPLTARLTVDVELTTWVFPAKQLTAHSLDKCLLVAGFHPR